MKTFITLTALFFSSLVFSQTGTTWKVSHNNRILLSASGENAETNTIAINRSALVKSGALELLYRPSRMVKDWERTILLITEDETELHTSKGNTFKLSNSTLRTLVKGKPRVMLYTVSLPKDPKQRALVRVRRIHLCTIEIKG